MNLTRTAIHRPVTTLMFSLALIFLGIVSYRELAVQQMPDIVFPAMGYGVFIKQGDPTPEEVNDEITVPFEKMVAALPGVKEMNSTTHSGGFWGYATFTRGTDVRFRAVELQNRVNKWMADKKGRLETRIDVMAMEQAGGEFMRLVLSVPIGQEARVSACSDLISRRLKSIDGITKVDISGNITPNIVLRIERDELVANGLSEQSLIGTLNRRAAERTYLGALQEGPRLRPVEMVSQVRSIAELLRIPLDDAGIFKVGEVAKPEKLAKETESIFRINGKKAVSVSIAKEKDRNTIRMSRVVRSRIHEMEKDLPKGFELTVLRDDSEILIKMMKNLAKMAALGTVLSMFVLLVFVRNWRVAAIVTISIPTSILVTFNAMYAAGLSINVLTLLGLTAGVGMLVDNAIVVVENVMRHSRLQRDPREAAWLGSREVVRALFVATATNLIVFIPLVFLDEDSLIILREGALSLVFPMAISLLTAMTLVPMLASKVIGFRQVKEHAKPAKTGNPLWARWNPWKSTRRRGRNLLREFVFFCAKGSIRHPIRLFFAIAGILFFTLLAASIKMAVQKFQGSSQTERISLFGKPKIGAEIEETDLMFQKKEQQIREEMAKADVIKAFHTRFEKTGGVIEMELNEPYQREGFWTYIKYFEHLKEGDDTYGWRLFAPFPEATRSNPMANEPWGGWGRQGRGQELVVISGENSAAMAEAAGTITEFINKQPAVDKQYTSLETPVGRAEAHFEPDLELFQAMKVDPMVMRSFFQSRDSRGVSTNLSLEEEGIQRNVTVKVVPYGEEEEKPVRQTLSQLRAAKVPLQSGGIITLDHLGAFSVKPSVSTISKRNRQRSIRILFGMQPTFYRPGMEKDRQDTLRGIQKSLAEIRLPTGVSASVGGTLDDVKSQKNLWKKTLWLALLMVFLVMAFSFESLISPFIILFTVPLAAIGGIWAIIAFKAELNEIALLGSLILLGLVVNPGILLIEFIQQMRREKGYRRPRALLFSVAYRLRPILMTTLTTVLGLIPILFASQVPKEARSLVSVIIGGMATSVLLTLVVIPTCYNVFSLLQESLQALALRKWELVKRAWKRAPLSAPAALLPAPRPPLEVEDLSIAIQNVSKIYPVFHKRKLLHFLPSRTSHYGCRPIQGKAALKHVDLHIGPGMFGLLGPNGAGKTTLMQILTGIIPQDFGTVRLAGHDLRSSRQGIRNLISYLPQNFGVYGSLTLMQYLEFFAPFYGLNDRAERRRRMEEVADMVGLADVKNKPMKRYSGGMRQRAGIAQMLLKPCPIMVVDEPTAGLDPVERVRFRLILSQLAQTRIIILSTHIVDDITSSCKEVAILNLGEIIYQGDLEQIKRNAEGFIWNIQKPASERVAIPTRQVLYRKHIGGDILYHYVSRDPLPGSAAITPDFEDAYIALLLMHQMRAKGLATPQIEPAVGTDDSEALQLAPSAAL